MKKTHKLWIKITALLLAFSVSVVSFSACGGKNSENDEREPVTLRIMSWNESFRRMMETYFIPRHPELMANVEIEWLSDEIVGYRQNVEQRLDNGEAIDLFLGDNDMAPFFTSNSHVASLKSLGISDAELGEQYQYTRLLGSDETGIQKGSAMTAEPGILLYRADYAAEYLGITHQEEMQEKLSSWDSFLEVARTLNERSEGKVHMLSGSAELWRSVDCAMAGLWLSDGRLSVSDETIAHWLDTVKELDASNAFLGVKSFDDEWYDAIDNGVFCFYSAPWLNKSVASDNAGITTIFSSSQHSGISFGKFKTSLAPNGFVYGGEWLYSSANSTHKELVGEIIRAFTCDKDFMRLIALGNLLYVNNAAVCEDLSALNISNPLFDGLDVFSVYQSAANGLEFSQPSVYDSDVSRLLYNQTKAYAKGEITLSQAAYNFRYNVWKKYADITDEPQKPTA